MKSNERYVKVQANEREREGNHLLRSNLKVSQRIPSMNKIRNTVKDHISILVVYFY